MSLRSNRLLVFLVKAIALVILIGVVWSYISPAYSRLLVGVGNRIAPSDVTLQIEQRTIYFYHETPAGTDKGWILSWSLQFGLVLVMALIGATPGVRWSQRVKFLAVAVVLLFVIHVMAVWIMARLMLSSPVMDKNPLFNLLVTVGCDLFPVAIWGALSLRYWFPEGVPGTEAGARHRERRKKKSG